MSNAMYMKAFAESLVGACQVDRINKEINDFFEKENEYGNTTGLKCSEITKGGKLVLEWCPFYDSDADHYAVIKERNLRQFMFRLLEVIVTHDMYVDSINELNDIICNG